MNFEFLRHTLGEILRFFYPGLLVLVFWTARNVTSVHEINVRKISNDEVVPYAALAFVLGLITYFLCRAVVFDYVMREVRHWIWEKDNWEKRWQKILFGILFGRPKDVTREAKAFHSRFTPQELAQYLSTRFGMVHAQMQTAFIFMLSPIMGSPGSIFGTRWYNVIIYSVSVVLIGSVLRQNTILWKIEKLISPAP